MVVLMGTVDESNATLWGSSEPASASSRPLSGPGDALTRPKYHGRLALSTDATELSWTTTQGVHSWNLKTLHFDKAWSGHGVVLAMADDGSRLLSSDERVAKPWRIIARQTGAAIATFDVDDPRAFWLATFSAGGKYIATATQDNEVVIGPHLRIV